MVRSSSDERVSKEFHDRIPLLSIMAEQPAPPVSVKKVVSRKSVKHADTHGGFPKIPKSNLTNAAMNAHSIMLRSAHTVA